jgi:glucan-binding YG repeat protein
VGTVAAEPSSSRQRQPALRTIQPQTAKGKEVRGPAPQTGTDPDNTPVEPAQSIMDRQVVLYAARAPHKKLTWAQVVTPTPSTHPPHSKPPTVRNPTPPTPNTQRTPVTTASPTLAHTPTNRPPLPAVHANRTGVVDKSLWIYVSNTTLPSRKRGWVRNSDSWRA